MKLKWDIKEWVDFGKRVGDTARFEAFVKPATREIAKILQEMLFQYTPVRTGNLAASWGGGENMAYEIKQMASGFRVTLINRAVNERGEKYGVWVNDGHRIFNQYGGPYGFVKGQFFVEKSIVMAEGKLDDVLDKELNKWWKWCVNG